MAEPDVYQQARRLIMDHGFQQICRIVLGEGVEPSAQYQRLREVSRLSELPWHWGLLVFEGIVSGYGRAEEIGSAEFQAAVKRDPDDIKYRQYVVARLRHECALANGNPEKLIEIVMMGEHPAIGGL